jgi:hypothetical protein
VSIEADPALLGVPYGNGLHFQVCLESGVCIFFQKGTFVYWNWFDGMVPRNLHVCGYLRQSDA